MVQVSDYIKLVVADNGIGLPVDIDLENTETLGLKMVNNLVHQLDGILELKRTNGTEFTIKCKKLEYKNRL
jgi:two-component sensor histidine kinase